MSDKSRYPVPADLGIEHAVYFRWLRRKAGAHLLPPSP
jgi:hypothetical protein